MNSKFKRIAMAGVLAGAVFLWGGHAAAADRSDVDSRYIEEHYPEAYRQIYQAGRNSAAAADEKPAASADKAPAAEKEKRRLGAWWEKNSLTYDPLPDQWLFHIEGTLDYRHSSGNVKSDVYNGSASLMVRKRRFTNTLIYIIDKEYKEQAAEPGAPPGKTDTDYRSFQEILRYDLAARLYSEGGYIWEKDTANYISDRDSYYVGLGYALIDTPQHLLDVFASGGYVEEAYPEPVKAAMHMSQQGVSAAYFREAYRWHITERLTYKENFRIIQDLGNTNVYNDDLADLHVTGQTHRYRWFLINELYIKIVNHLSFMIGCKIDYDSNPWPTVDKRDTAIKSGIQFSF